MTMTWGEVAAVVFRRPESWARTNLPPGFPPPDPILNLVAGEAVETWVRQRFGLAIRQQAPDHDAEATLLARARDPHAQHRRPISRRPAA
jgi:hypothetical protein